MTQEEENERRNHMVRLYRDDGLTLQQTADRLGVSLSLVHVTLSALPGYERFRKIDRCGPRGNMGVRNPNKLEKVRRIVQREDLTLEQMAKKVGLGSRSAIRHYIEKYDLPYEPRRPGRKNHA